MKNKIEKMIKYGEGMIINDAGSGSGGPAYISPEELTAMLAAGEFDDLEVVELDSNLLKETAVALDVEIDDTDDWRQIEFNFGDNNYRQIGWVCE